MGIFELLLASAGCSVFTFLGGLAFTRFQENPTHSRILPSVISAGGGYLIAISFFELLPISMERHRDQWHQIAGLVVLGAGTVALAHSLMRHGLKIHADRNREDHDEEHAHSCHSHSHGHACCAPILGVPTAQAAIGCVVICSLFDGLLVTSGFQAGARVGLGLLVGQVFHLVPEGVIAASLALASGLGSRASRGCALSVGIAFFLGSLIPFLISSRPLWALPFSLGIALYVALRQLLPMALRNPGSWRWLACGVGFYFFVHRLIEH
ncbi:MAG: hypothetical protein P4M08_10545 [Oligoflexia bacterium]|nr:hypothetical protein [Oligoflexia bacterium]